MLQELVAPELAVPRRNNKLWDHGWLRIVGSANAISLKKSRITIGSANDNTLVLDDDAVSPHHCELRWDAGALSIETLGLCARVWVNGIAVKTGQLKLNDHLLIGNTAAWIAYIDSSGHPAGMIGNHPLMQEVYRKISRFGSTAQPILISGETGTGKELVARAVHQASAVRDGPFEVANCAAIAHELAESQLFGHEKGAFTGAVRDCSGFFSRADGGTLFLDEIGELPLSLQPKLLRVLEDKRVHPLGAKSSRSVKVRIVAATNRDLRKASRAGEFRADLYHRLAVGIIDLPPLRTRPSDIPLLVQHFLAEYSAGSIPVRVTEDALHWLSAQQWPGNVRALKAALDRASMSGGLLLSKEDFYLVEDDDPLGGPDGYIRYEGRCFEEIKRDIYLRVLSDANGNRTRAAALLGIPKSTFTDHLRAMKI